MQKNRDVLRQVGGLAVALLVCIAVMLAVYALLGRLDRLVLLGAVTKLSIAQADDETFRCLAACKKAIRKGGLAPCAANGANEAAVAHFLRDEIGFLDIGRLVEGIVDSDSFGGDYTLSDVYECDRMARAYVEAHI